MRGIFHDSANDMLDDMNKITGVEDCPYKIGSACTLKCDALHPFNKTKRDACKANCPAKPPAGGDGEPPAGGEGEPPAGGGAGSEIDPNAPKPPAAGSMLDFSSPTNTIVKSLFLLSLSPMFAGTIHFYFLSVGCAGAILYTLTKSILK